MERRPQIYTKTNLLNSYSNYAGSKVTVLMGTSSWGPLNELTSISSVSEFVSKFGDDITGNTLTLVKGVDLFLRNGGGLKVIRVAHTGYDKADNMFQSSSTNVINFEALYNGTHGNNISVTITANSTNPTYRDISITDGTITEIYNNGQQGYSTNDAIASAINGNSQLVALAVETGQGTTNIVDAVTATYLTGGNNGTTSLDVNDYISTIDNILWTEDFNYLGIPGQTDNSFQNSIVGRLTVRASSEKKYSRYISGVAVDETISTMTARTTDNKRLSLVAPSVKYYHRYDADYTYIDGSYLACAYLGKLTSLETEVSMTHKLLNIDGVQVLASTSQLYYNKSEQEAVLQANVIPITKIGTSIQCVSGITRLSDATNIESDGVIVDIIDYTTEQVENYLNKIVGNPQTEERRSLYGSQIDAILQGLVREEIITEFATTMVQEGSSPDSITVDVAIKPTYNVKFVYLTINVQ